MSFLDNIKNQASSLGGGAQGQQQGQQAPQAAAGASTGQQDALGRSHKGEPTSCILG